MHCPRRAVVRQKNPLRSLSASERRALEQLARSHSAPALSVARARALLAVSEGWSYTEAAQLVGRARRFDRAMGDAVQSTRIGSRGTPARWSTTDAVRRRGAGADCGGVSAAPGSRAGWNSNLVVEHVAA